MRLLELVRSATTGDLVAGVYPYRYPSSSACCRTSSTRSGPRIWPPA